MDTQCAALPYLLSSAATDSPAAASPSRPATAGPAAARPQVATTTAAAAGSGAMSRRAPAQASTAASVVSTSIPAHSQPRAGSSLTTAVSRPTPRAMSRIAATRAIHAVRSAVTRSIPAIRANPAGRVNSPTPIPHRTAPSRPIRRRCVSEKGVESIDFLRCVSTISLPALSSWERPPEPVRW